MENTSVHDYIAEAAKLSGCAWKCHARNCAAGDGGGFSSCCSHCQGIAEALAAAANQGPRHVSSDSAALHAAKEVVQVTEDTSDGYHTFRELYEYRKAYNALLFNEWAARGLYDVHKARRHHDGEACFDGGWFIVVAQTPCGQISNHYKDDEWALFDVPERERGNEWDGHTPAVALERLLKLASLHAATAPQEGWQPIETAPKDGTMILVDEPRKRQLRLVEWHTTWKWWMSVPGRIQVRPTRWMPLPAAPQVAQEDDEEEVPHPFRSR